MALLKQYFKLRDEYREKLGENTLLLMEVGSFYEIYTKVDKNTKEITEPQIIHLRKYAELAPGKKTEEVLMLGFSSKIPFLLEKYLEKMINNGYSAVIYDQDAPTSNTTRSLKAIYSPGTYFYESSNDDVSNHVACIWIESHKKTKINKSGNIVIGMSVIDNYTGKSSFYQIISEHLHNPTTYDELERFISSYNPKECIFISNFSPKEINDVIQFVKLESKKTHVFDTNEPKVKKVESQTYQREILEKFFSFNISESLFKNSLEFTYAVQSYVYLLNFVYEHNPSLVNKICEPIVENKSERMLLANHSLEQLNILPDKNYSGKLASVSDFLNNCITSMGIRSFKYNILNPLTCREKIQEKYDITEYLLTTSYYDSWRNELKNIKDIEKLNRQIYLKKITPQNLFYFYENLSSIETLYSKLSSDSVIINYLNNKITMNIQNVCKEFKQVFENTFLLEDCKNINSFDFDMNFIKQGINKDLDKYVELNLDSKSKIECMRVYLDDLIAKGEKSKKNDFVKIHSTDKNGYNLQCTSRRSKILAEQIKDKVSEELTLINDNGHPKKFSFTIKTISYETATGSNVNIVNEDIRKVCIDIISSRSKMKDLITLEYFKFIKKLEDYEKEFYNLIQFVSHIDLLQNMCYIATKHKYCKPEIKEADKSYVNVKELRHPLIEKLNTDEIYIANDLNLGNEQNIMLLYGTNAVGKTSFIRALGICIIMAQSGLYVPCSELIYSPYKSIFTRILGNDNLFKGLSTFAVEMSELRVILNNANENSLILGDELCSGTEHDSAVSIFVSGLEMLYKNKVTAIFATHIHEIVNYEEIENMETLVIKHMEVEYDEKNDKLIYNRKLKNGPGSCMYGLEVCKSLHLPDDFLSNAYNLRRKYKKEERSVLELKTSHFNSKKVMGNCELCKKNLGTEVHHLQHQENADENNMIGSFHKNHPANLLTLCEECHNKIHKSKKQHRKIKTSNGMEIIEVAK
jgi:DNA mismatch repair protein MutS